MTDIFLEKPDPFKELTFVFGTFGWETRLWSMVELTRIIKIVAEESTYL
jgi:hypothetical protein